KIGIIGAGNMGAGLGKLWAKAGHEVVFSYSRDRNKLLELATAAGATAKAGTIQEAAAQDIILLAVWLPALEEVIHAAGSLDGKKKLLRHSILHLLKLLLQTQDNSVLIFLAFFTVVTTLKQNKSLQVSLKTAVTNQLMQVIFW
ncbi:MAG: NAD(P)-binding domain-containing protein, partial [Microcoleus sp. PH2017_01_SCD_O_A]|uniref:NAD(P)-binding domain-containing protein n=1 Tax=Microcoleus sp. PH2017_01_SCD_O_A TaxID=2798812 RepID=UPI001E05DD0F